MPELTCWNCGASLAALPRPITRHMNCPACFEDLHCCRQCRHYQANSTFPCAEDRAEPPVHKEGANFCDYFRPTSDAYRAGRADVREAAKARLDALFAASEVDDADPVDADQPSADDDARRKLEELFR